MPDTLVEGEPTQSITTTASKLSAELRLSGPIQFPHLALKAHTRAHAVHTRRAHTSPIPFPYYTQYMKHSYHSHPPMSPNVCFKKLTKVNKDAKTLQGQ